jgi:voltage-gated potassium channel
MERQAAGRRMGERVQKRIQRKGLTPRVAASVIAASWVAAVVFFGVVEHLVDPDTFDNVWLGMWWAMQTVTTVGYGDVVPEQTAGKVVAAFLMLGGLSLFAVITGAITSAFVAQAQARRGMSEEEPMMRKLDEMTTQLAAMKADLARLHRRPD